jgi:hypothetical protein
MKYIPGYDPFTGSDVVYTDSPVLRSVMVTSQPGSTVTPSAAYVYPKIGWGNGGLLPKSAFPEPIGTDLAVAYVCEAIMPFPVVPSPQSHA